MNWRCLLPKLGTHVHKRVEVRFHYTCFLAFKVNHYFFIYVNEFEMLKKVEQPPFPFPSHHFLFCCRLVCLFYQVKMDIPIKILLCFRPMHLLPPVQRCFMTSSIFFNFKQHFLVNNNTALLLSVVVQTFSNRKHITCHFCGVTSFRRAVPVTYHGIIVSVSLLTSPVYLCYFATPPDRCPFYQKELFFTQLPNQSA